MYTGEPCSGLQSPARSYGTWQEKEQEIKQDAAGAEDVHRDPKAVRCSEPRYLLIIGENGYSMFWRSGRQSRLVTQGTKHSFETHGLTRFRLWLQSNLLWSQFWEGIFFWSHARLSGDVISYLSPWQMLAIMKDMYRASPRPTN